MGIFGFGKKKQKTNEMDELFKDNNMSTNERQDTARQSRKDAVAGLQRQQDLEIKHDQIRDKFKEIRKIMMMSDSETISGRYLEKFEEILKTYDKVGKVDNRNSNVNAEHALDNLILNELDKIYSGCIKQNVQDVNSTLWVLKQYVQDRFDCNPYYADKDYVAAVVDRMNLKIELQAEMAKKVDLQRQLNDLKELRDSNNPDVLLDNIAFEAKQIHDEANEIDERIAKYNQQIALDDQTIAKTKTRVVVHSNDKNYNRMEKAEGAMVAKAENEADEAAAGVLLGGLKGNKRNVANSELEVDDSVVVKKKPDVQLSDDLFKL